MSDKTATTNLEEKPWCFLSSLDIYQSITCRLAYKAPENKGSVFRSFKGGRLNKGHWIMLCQKIFVSRHQWNGGFGIAFSLPSLSLPMGVFLVFFQRIKQMKKWKQLISVDAVVWVAICASPGTWTTHFPESKLDPLCSDLQSILLPLM